jgi:phosphoribosylglycinamide formyltransferase 1
VKLIIFASGTKDGGGSGFENLVNASRAGILDADIVAVVSNHEHGGVRARAEKLGIPFIHFIGPWIAKEYQKIIQKTEADFVALSGWLKLVCGLDPQKTFNIHPGPLPRFGGPGLYGRHVHEAVHEAYARGEISETEVCMHFVTDEYDKGPIFARIKCPLNRDDTPDTIAHRVNDLEHTFQPLITNLVVQGKITWDGKNPASLTAHTSQALSLLSPQ